MEPVSSLNTQLSQLLPQARAARGAKVSEEFLTIFYKAMLKEAIKSPALTFNSGDEDNKSYFSALNQDVLVEQFAKQLAKSQMASQKWLPVPEGKK